MEKEETAIREFTLQEGQKGWFDEPTIRECLEWATKAATRQGIDEWNTGKTPELEAAFALMNILEWRLHILNVERECDEIMAEYYDDADWHYCLLSARAIPERSPEFIAACLLKVSEKARRGGPRYAFEKASKARREVDAEKAFKAAAESERKQENEFSEKA